jgi:hypothetical protein
MGWTYAFERPADPRAALDRLLTWSDQRGTRRVLDSAIVRLRVYYAAVEHIAPDGGRQVWAAVFLVDFRRGADGLAFGYKDMTEHMGPVESECPERILRRLTPLTEAEDPQGWARAWRERCRAHLTARRSQRLTDGAQVKTRAAFALPSGDCDLFTAVRSGRAWRFRASTDGRLYRLRGYQSVIDTISAPAEPFTGGGRA